MCQRHDREIGLEVEEALQPPNKRMLTLPLELTPGQPASWWSRQGVKQTTGVTKVVCYDSVDNNSLLGNNPALLYEGDDCYGMLAEKGKPFFDGLSYIGKHGAELDDGTQKESFIGEECIKLVGKYEQLLDHIKLKTVSPADEVNAHAAWSLWRQQWTLLLKPVDPSMQPGDASLPAMHLRVARATEVKVLAEAFVKAFVNAADEYDDATV
eukprot:jgi/Tetstr1/459125/TSEL_004573.t1